MTREEIKAILGEGATEEQIKSIMDINGNDINNVRKTLPDANELKRLQGLDAEVQRLKGVETELRALKQSSETEAEKVQRLLDESQRAVDEAEKVKADFTLKSNRLIADGVLIKAGVTIEGNESLIDAIVSADAEKTKTLAEGLASLISKKTEDATKEAKKEGMNKTKTPATSGGKKPAEPNETVPSYVQSVIDRHKTMGGGASVFAE